MIDVKRLVIAVRGNTPYHYWRDCKEVDKFGMFQISLTIKDGTYDISGTHIIYKKKRIADWNEVMDIIEALQVEKLREVKLKRLLNES